MRMCYLRVCACTHAYFWSPLYVRTTAKPIHTDNAHLEDKTPLFVFHRVRGLLDAQRTRGVCLPPEMLRCVHKHKRAETLTHTHTHTVRQNILREVTKSSVSHNSEKTLVYGWIWCSPPIYHRLRWYLVWNSIKVQSKCVAITVVRDLSHLLPISTPFYTRSGVPVLQYYLSGLLLYCCEIFGSRVHNFISCILKCL